jgi:hypothetical protein
MAVSNRGTRAVARDAVTSGSIVVAMLLVLDAAMDSWVIIVVADREPKMCWINVTVAKEKESSEYWLRKDIQNSIENRLRVWGNDVSTFANAPCNWVQTPEESSESTAHKICTADISTETVGVLAGLKSKLVDNVYESDAAFKIVLGRVYLFGECEKLTKCKVSPLIVADNESADEAGNNHDPIDQNNP